MAKVKRTRRIPTTRSPSKPKDGQIEKKPKAVRTRKITEYFPVRKSTRVPAKQLKEEKMRHLEELVMTGANEPELEVAICGHKGRGLRAMRSFSRGEFVVEYKGDIIPYNEATQREKEYTKNPRIGSYMYFFKFGEERMCVDATAETPYKGRLLNHSALKPNLYPRVLDFGHFICVGLFALRDIDMGEELLYDYGDHSRSSVEMNPWLKQS